MTKFFYFLSTFAESGLSVFGIRSPYEQPSYQVVQHVSPSIEIRRYEARMAVETAMTPGNEGEAFGRLFRYITGANRTQGLLPMAETSAMVAMTVPVVSSGTQQTMRFFLPKSVASSGAPTPTDPLVHVVSVPAVQLGVIRFTGAATASLRETETQLLRKGLSQAGKVTDGAPIYMSYDPPFTIPFLRRNEVAIPCK